MKYSCTIITSLLLLIFSGCKSGSGYTGLPDLLTREFDNGNFSHLKIITDSLKILHPGNDNLLRKADSLLEIANRISLDFSVTGRELKVQLENRIGEFSEHDKNTWEELGWLEWKMIDGEKRYFNRAASNLDLIKSFHLERASRDSAEAKSPELIFRKEHTQRIIRESGSNANPAVPVEMTINYTVTVKPDAVPAGEKVRCWLPYPKENNPRQQNVALISSSNGNSILAPDSATHKTLYMEGTAEKGKPLLFSVSFSYRSSGQFFTRERLRGVAYDRNSKLYRDYTSEELPHISFTPEVKRLADSVCGSETEPYEIVSKIYKWFSSDIPWAGALEYSVMKNIPEYVLRNRRGDCGMQTFLFMSMLRYKGIPVKWQSGWKVPPEGKNLHDWCEVFYEGVGWVPADVSYGLQYSDDPVTRDFYISGIDSYRLIINDGVAGTLYPPGKFLRSEPFDFQRGEVEWDGGNLYFDKWDYKMDIKYNN